MHRYQEQEGYLDWEDFLVEIKKRYTYSTFQLLYGRVKEKMLIRSISVFRI
jgi:hypothetical protein